MGSRLYLFASQVFFTAALGPLFLWPKVGGSRPVRSFVAFSFGRLLAPRYSRVISSFGELYGVALDEGLNRAEAVAESRIGKVIDCGTGTGFAATRAALRFPEASVIGFDLVTEMLEQARSDAARRGLRIAHVRADANCLPLADGAADLVIAHNTAPFLSEFARVCRRGGVVVFVDSAARWIAPVARRAAARTGCFDLVEARQTQSGFFLVARRS
ncbi:MAG TPA: class I SAM-dependent methyltransferase [Pyrinomonadaceae bacterium]|nr:class I SAM-dependent methyltransferase [Pyrinomonadaceae bacterium]